MRFRAAVEAVSVFYKITQAVEKLQKRFIIKFTPENMHIICNHEANEGGTQVWSQIKIDSIFADYRIQSNADNQITMAISSEALLAALRSASASSTSATAYQVEEILMKLAKKNDRAVLRFDITGTTSVGRRVKVTHDVLVDVMKPHEVAKLAEPLCPDPDLHILLPPLQKLRTIVERLRPMSDILAFRANNNGKLQVSISTETARVQTEWKNLLNPKLNEEQAEEEGEKDLDKIFTVHVSTRSFLKFLNSHVISTSTIACVCQNHCLILYVYIGDATDVGGVLTFYIPAIIDGD
ncbi:cell cycle checkpoint [Macrolepiota fuliginosa MF-IS2]|uniref:Checkpoint protein n=1 Tax=Macrolepiota fuliginosa MF-IS2 TaxID=1400762 RepID=A0A9P5X770_9AGAR|nr:cell cycle checkpoint [Macrolepiota fuliginosa MF-IS2]